MSEVARGAAARIVSVGGRLLQAGGVLWLAALAYGAYGYLRNEWAASDAPAVVLGTSAWVFVAGGSAGLVALFGIRHSVLGGVASAFGAAGAFVVTFVFTGVVDVGVVAAAGLAIMGAGWLLLGSRLRKTPEASRNDLYR